MRRRIGLVILDAAIVAASGYISLFLRLDGDIPKQYLDGLLTVLPLTIACYLAAFAYFKLYRQMWEYASIRELIIIVKAATAGAAGSTLCTYLIGWTLLPRSVHIIEWIITIGLIGLSRMSSRIIRDVGNGGSSGGRSRTLIVGAGDAGMLVARELLSPNSKATLHPVGFVDDDPGKRGLMFSGLKVLGDRRDIPRLVERHDVDTILIAMPSVPGRTVREIIDICGQTKASIKVLPGVYELINGRVRVSRIRSVSVEDLLRREPVKVDLEGIAGYLKGKVVLVTGGAGSIGSELCRQVCSFKPAGLIVLDNSENGLFEIELELRKSYPEAQIVPCLADVKDHAKIETVFSRHRPQVVFHAAAYKHVPMMEVNPDEAVKNNVGGTIVVACAAKNYGAEVFIYISTDKAVNPTSVMGATKRVGELIVQSMNGKGKTRFASVRFGNVLGSRGSVVPIFASQIAKGGPVTVTHEDMQRYFMTIPEAVQLVIQAGALAQGGEIFVLDMGEPVKIIDLARDMIRLSGLRPDVDIKIEITGIRPGEKLCEELLSRKELLDVTRHQRIFIARENGEEDLEKIGAVLKTYLKSLDAAVGSEISQILPELSPSLRQSASGRL
ncbi:polysaccharide biosynthesis protein CapD [Syntrophothermus lipocalidus DSM 12680]|uniref:Polysaccharide biosynthesis protein CapD n=1 Tax=Syntrophothermus lipocalidus (strain DSM 12680 / TGB-C1) TaxID=643648 RepID=D7CJ72_SYNLT|nr:polysaccharide biosynthesis protein CapD [Syntrophothermus lipocalidus DSM 12680]